MWKPSVLILALVFSTSTGKHIPKTEEWKLALPKSSFLFQSHDRIVVVAKSSPNSVSLSYVGDDNFSCVVPTNPEYLNNGLALGNGKLVIFGRRGTSEFRFTMIIVDPRDGSTQLVTKDYVQDSQPRIVAYYESLDVFVDNCAPCRYDDRARRVELSCGLKVDDKISILKPMKEFDRSKGYFYAGSFKNGSSVLRILNEEFGVKSEMVVDKEIVTAFVSSDGNIEACFIHHRGTHRSSACQLLTDDLRVIGESDEHISGQKKYARLIYRPISDQHMWKTLSVFETKDKGNHVQRSCLKEVRLMGADGMICNTIETPRLNLDVFVFEGKACVSMVNYYGDLNEVEIKCLVSQ